MASSSTISQESSGSPAWLASVLIPGLGQFLAGKRGRGLLIFIFAALLTPLMTWAQTGLKLDLVSLGTAQISWLWLALLAYWGWNVYDAYKITRLKSFNFLPLVFFAAIILYVIAWNVTDIRLNRLVERFGDARKMAVNLVNPDVISITVNGEDQVCAWSCLYDYFHAQSIGQPVAGPIKVSENLLDIIGRIKSLPAPRWMVKIGLVPEGTRYTGYEAGSLIETIAIGLMATIFSTILAIPLSFLAAHNIMSRIPGGTAIYYAMRGILNVVRAIDTVVWGLIVIVWVGLGTFAGVIALTIHSVAALGKLLSEEIEHIDEGPVEALTASGANLLQVIRFAVLPQVTPSFLAYSLLRWDINMRSATVIGFVAGGGMGFFVIEATRQGAYPQYAAALWSIALVIILVDYISAKLRERILRDEPPPETKQQNAPGKRILRIALTVAGLLLFAYCWQVSEISIPALFDPGKNFGRLLLDFIRVDLTPDVLRTVLQQMVVTIFQGLLATTLGALLALPFSFLAARNLTGKSCASLWIYYLTRGMLNVLRSIEALLYVVIFILWVGIGPFAGMMALAATSFALIGKLFSEAIENIDPGPIEALNATGANRLQMIAYAILPQIVPPFVSYLIYQWDINIRMATIIGFAGGGGIGLTLTTYFGSLQYHKAGTVVLFIVFVVAVMDFASAKLRQNLV